jgi:hypothetical protein
MHALLIQVPEYVYTAQWCHRVCYPLLAKHIARTDIRLRATPSSVAQVVLRVEAAEMVQGNVCTVPMYHLRKHCR